ncbi:MAG TPA: diguanylate cyclase [Polyangiaceae bacterium]|jgi:diguanylate cyclase (GGDEF)-like protein
MIGSDPIATLLALTERLSQDATLEVHLAAVTDAALVLLPADHASIRIVDASGDELLACARSGTGTDHHSLPLRKGEGVAGWVLANARAALVADTRTDDRFLRASGQGFAIASLVAAPLVHGGQAIGVLSASSSVPRAFDAGHERRARLLAACSVPALERARLVRLAVTDDLTLAYNGRYLLPRLQEELQRARAGGAPVSIAMLDLDHFKQVNDTFGHARGDGVLRAFADRVRDRTRRSDLLVRRGGEEFVLVLPAADGARAFVLAERIRHAVGGAPMPVTDGASITQTVSIGVATWDGTESAEALLHRADLALYEAKNLGRDRVVAA